MSTSNLTIVHLRTEYLQNPLGIDVLQPRLAWQITSRDPEARAVVQRAYRIQVAPTHHDLVAGNNLLWDTGKVASDRSTQIVYAGASVTSAARYYWRVQIWDGDDIASDWSESAWWEMGLLDTAEWQAAWIAPAAEAVVINPGYLLRREFDVKGEVAQARLYATALGVYVAEVNGRPVTDALFRPGWTSYNKRLQYQTYDVTGQIVPGRNAIGVTLVDGWYRGRMMGKGDRRALYGDTLGLRLQLHLRYTDGSEEVVATSIAGGNSDGESGWKSSTGPVVSADHYDGEVYDARLEQPGWSSTAFDDSAWAGIKPVDAPSGVLVAQIGTPVTRQEELSAKSIVTSATDEVVLDFGQNMVGWVRLRVRGKAGDVVTLRYAEVLNPDGTLYVDNLRSAKAIDTYTLRGNPGDNTENNDAGEEIWEPQFTFHGFRYVGVSDYPGKVTAASITGIVVHSDLPPAGSFACSNPLINQLQSNIQWGQKGNFLDVPTDCPQRDERMGWTGDAQVFARTAIFNREVAPFYTRWLRDLAADQGADGSVPYVIPDVLYRGGATAWGDAALIVPWTMYLTYGDVRILAEQYTSMRAWVEYMRAQAGDSLLWLPTSEQFGDWVAVEAQDEKFPHPVTSYGFLCTAFFAYSTDLLAKAAHLIGKDAEAEEYSALAPQIKAALHKEFIAPSGRIDGNTQTNYVIALHFDLLPEVERAEAVRRLAAEVHRFDDHLSTGFIGTPYLCHVLARFGELDLAYKVVEQETWPSWLYTVKQRATTMWERWDSIRPDGSFGNVSMNSFNHYAYGAIGEWLYQVVAGIDVDSASPGYKRTLIAPRPGGTITWARASHATPYGEVVSSWQLEDGVFSLEAVIPPNSEGVVRLPATAINVCREGGRPLDKTPGIHSATVEGESVLVEIGSGHYYFTVAAS